VPALEQFGAIRQLLDRKLIRFAGLSEASVDDIVAASKVFPVATVQNRYNVLDRASEDVVAYCEEHGIGFIPWFPLATGRLASAGGALAELAKELEATPSQLALAWLLRRSPAMLPIPGTASVAHLEENIAAAAIELTDEQFERLAAGAGAAALRVAPRP
jgi:aryl-alcohol dehydrogenase-like predicted oxidoreductase